MSCKYDPNLVACLQHASNQQWPSTSTVSPIERSCRFSLDSQHDVEGGLQVSYTITQHEEAVPAPGWMGEHVVVAMVVAACVWRDWQSRLDLSRLSFLLYSPYPSPAPSLTRNQLDPPTRAAASAHLM